MSRVAEADLNRHAYAVWVVPSILVMTWLYVGLFITAHDAMHGSLSPRHPRLNDERPVWLHSEAARQHVLCSCGEPPYARARNGAAKMDSLTEAVSGRLLRSSDEREVATPPGR